MNSLGEINQVSKILQRSNVTVRSDRVYFDSELKSDLSLHSRPDPDAHIVNNPEFEAAALKIQEKDENNLSADEKLAASALIGGNSVETAAESDSNSIVERATKTLSSEGK